MTRDRIIQIVALLSLIVALSAASATLPALLRLSDEHSLRYTDVSVEGAPPIVAIGTAIGALRGLIVDYLWIKVHINKEKGLYFEVMADSDLITKLQPRFAPVWAFHGHNMAYNISVATHTEAERWEWVNAGIRLVRNRGVRYNPNDLNLHRELAWWFAHKIEGVADDAHLYYKTEFCREWHFVLGQPPEGYEERIAWIKEIADAPETLAEAERRTPGVRALVDRLSDELKPFQRPNESFALNSRILHQYGWWKAVKEQSVVAELMGLEEQFRRTQPLFNVIEEVAADPQYEAAWSTLLAHTRKRVLKDEYNMDPDAMYRYTRDYGPLDWRHGEAHALYWTTRGMELGEARVRVFGNEQRYRIINNDRIRLQSMQALARWGRISFDPFSAELPGRFPEPKWVDTIMEEWETVYVKHYDSRGAGGETFITFMQNFMHSAIREYYRSGQLAQAQQIMDSLDALFGTGQMEGPIGANYRYSQPLDVFVREEIAEEYWFQPHLAPSEVAAALRRGIRIGVGQDQPDVYEQALRFADGVTKIFRDNEYYNYSNKFGRGRMQELLAQLDRSLETAFLQLMADPTLTLQERLTIWRQMEQFDRGPDTRRRVYDRLYPAIARQFQTNPLSMRYKLEQLFPEPPGMAQFRVQEAQRRREAEQRLEQQRQRGEIERN